MARLPQVLLAATLALAVACTDPGTGGSAPGGTGPPAPGTPTQPVTATPPNSPTAPAAGPAPPPAAAGPATFDRVAAVATVHALAETIGRREATSPAYLRAAALVEARFRALGYRVRRQALAVPAGNSWGVPVRAGATVNVIAEPPAPAGAPAGTAAGPPGGAAGPTLLVGAHLDTVPASPGANDNASGVAVLLELARLARLRPPPVPVTFVAFGAEEPRGPGDDDHHFGSRAYVAAMPPAARRALAGMVSLDRVGYGGYVPVCDAGRLGGWLAPALRAAARRLGVPARRCENRSSDHWSFVRGGMVGVRVGSHPHPGYHGPGDRARLVDPTRLQRAGQVVWAVLSAGPPR